MEVMTFVVPCLFGLEGLAAEELRRLGLDSVQAEMAGSCFRAVRRPWPWPTCGYGPESGCFAPGKGPARSFEELFQIVATTPLEEVIPVMENSCKRAQPKQPASLRTGLPGHCKAGCSKAPGSKIRCHLAAGDRGIVSAAVFPDAR